MIEIFMPMLQHSTPQECMQGKQSALATCSTRCSNADEKERETAVRSGRGTVHLSVGRTRANNGTQPVSLLSIETCHPW